MAYATGYEYDLFISYAEVDDIEPAADDGTGWVALFVHLLEIVLASRLGGREKLRIYHDRRDLGGNHDLQELLDAAGKSALFLAVTSPAYAEREWTKRELETFVSEASDARRLFAVEYLPLDQGERYPEPLNDRKRLKFWETGEVSSTTAVPLALMDHSSRNRIHDLAGQIKKQLVAINSAELVRPAISHAAKIIADDKASRTKGIVYLAQATDDLEEERLQVQRYLEQFGFFILPLADLPGGGEAFRIAAEADIKQADLYVHLLGPKAGRYPADLSDGYGATQIKLARAAGKETLMWRHPQLDLATVTDKRQQSLLSDPSIILAGLQSFMAEARRKLETRPKQDDRKRNSTSLVFIDANENDFDVAKIVQQEFSARRISTVVPLYTGSAEDVHRDLTENMVDCDVLVFIYGRSPPSWVRSQMRLFSKLRPGARARLVAIFVGPPDDKPADFGFNLAELRRVDFPKGWSAEPIRELIEEIEA